MLWHNSTIKLKGYKMKIINTEASLLAVKSKSGMNWMQSMLGTPATATASGTGGWLAPASGLLGAGLNYAQNDLARKDKIQMFDKMYKAEQKQTNFQNTEYLAKKKAEEEAWSNFGKSGDPYAQSQAQNTIV